MLPVIFKLEVNAPINWSGIEDSNSFGQLGRLKHNPYANPAFVWRFLLGSNQGPPD